MRFFWYGRILDINERDVRSRVSCSIYTVPHVVRENPTLNDKCVTGWSDRVELVTGFSQANVYTKNFPRGDYYHG